MKMNKKKVFTLALAVCLIAILSMGSLAWFTDSDEIKNEFMIAGSDDEQDPDKVFSVDVWENTPDGDKDDDGYIYKDVLPGDELKKEVRVENTGSYDQYIRVLVEISDAAALIADLGEDYVFENCFVNCDLTKWQPVGVNRIDDKLVVVLYYTEVLGAGETINLFDAVQIPEELTREGAAALAGGFEITVKAHAVQTENVGANAYEAFKTVGWDALAEYTNP